MPSLIRRKKCWQAMVARRLPHISIWGDKYHFVKEGAKIYLIIILSEGTFYARLVEKCFLLIRRRVINPSARIRANPTLPRVAWRFLVTPKLHCSPCSIFAPPAK
eukprot:GEMP01076547.1.p1 GENE.GEMP01076547.1~~GEMP01076547.1.p1  ORF type:complete len:105 (+),score=5.80 GEMP01076547.1:650-964(+)